MTFSIFLFSIRCSKRFLTCISRIVNYHRRRKVRVHRSFELLLKIFCLLSTIIIVPWKLRLLRSLHLMMTIYHTIQSKIRTLAMNSIRAHSLRILMSTIVSIVIKHIYFICIHHYRSRSIWFLRFSRCFCIYWAFGKWFTQIFLLFHHSNWLWCSFNWIFILLNQIWLFVSWFDKTISFHCFFHFIC